MDEQWTKPSESPASEPLEPLRDDMTAPAETAAQPERPPVDLRQARHAFRRVELFAFLLMLIFQVVGIIAVVITLFTKPRLIASEWFLCLVSWMPLYLIALPACYPLLRRLPRSVPETEKLGGSRLFSIFLICIFLTYACDLASILVLSILEAITGLTAINPADSMVNGIWSTLLFAVILAPLGEEFICRRLILDRLCRYGEKTAILVSALLFALLHGNLSQALYAFALGCVFGYVYLRTGRLRYCVGLHMAVNAVGGLLPALLVTPLLDRVAALNPEALTMEQLMPVAGSLLGALLYGALLLAAIIAGLVLLIKRRKRICLLPAEEELPAGQRFRIAFLNPGMILAVLLFLVMTAMTFLQ